LSVEVSEAEADVEVVSLGEADVEVVSLGEADVEVVSLGDGDVVVCVAVGEAVVELAVTTACPDTADADAAPGSARVMASSAAPAAAATPAAAGAPAARVTFQDRGKTSPLSNESDEVLQPERRHARGSLRLVPWVPQYLTINRNATHDTSRATAR
jgi:hypothetical protein